MSTKIGILGYGRMGKMIEQVALKRKNTVSDIIDRPEKFNAKKISSEVFIDFTLPSAVIENIQKCCDAKKPMVIGTTGWYEKKNKVDTMAKKAGIPIIYGGNFSLGVNLFLRAMEKVAHEFSAFADEYDVFTHEFHHRNKVDSPGGTALELAHIVQKKFSEKTEIQGQALTDRAIQKEELHVSSTRGGSIPGTHSVYFDSPFDTVECTHRARTREGFAYGAVLAAEKISQLSPGLHHFPDIFEELFSSTS